MKKRVLSICLSLVLAASFAGCGTKTADNATKSDSTSKPAQNVKFTLWHSYVGSDQRAPFMQEMMPKFKAKYPNYEIDEQQIPRDQYQTKLKTQAAAGQLPESFVIWPNAMTKEFSQAGLLADINDLLDKNKAWKDGFTSRALDEFTFNGKTYSAGLGVSVTSIVFYNKAIFDQNKVSYPKTYNELKDAIKTFSSKGIIPIAVGNKPKWPMQSSTFSLIANRETGSEWLDNALANKGAKFTDPEFIKALTDVKELTDLGAFNKDYNSIDNVQARDYYYQGKAAMMIEGSWAVPDVITKTPADVKANTVLTILPSFGGKGKDDVMSGVSATGFAINAKATPAQKAAIEDLIVFMTDADAQKVYVKSNIPVGYKNVALDKSTVDPIYQQLTDLINKYPLVTVYDSALSSEQADIVNNGLQSIMVGQKTPEDIAKQLQATIK